MMVVVITAVISVLIKVLMVSGDGGYSGGRGRTIITAAAATAVQL